MQLATGTLENISLDRFKELKFNPPTGTLFDIDVRYAVYDHVCPYCFCKLYEMRGKNLMYCKSKKHKNKFIISKSKLVNYQK